MTHPRLLLCYLPFGPIEHPYLGLGLLKATLKQSGMDCDLRYLALNFIHTLGIELYLPILSDSSLYRLLGEWIFTQPENNRTITHQSLPDPYQYWLHKHYPEEIVNNALKLFHSTRQCAETFLEECLEKVNWDRYDVVGFSVGLDQLGSSLGLAKRLKSRFPHIFVLFGGRQCFLPKGAELLSCFPFIDYVCLGEGEFFLPEFLKRMKEGRDMDDLPGLAYRRDGQVVTNFPRPALNLDKLPPPDYDDFIEQYQTIFGKKWNRVLYFESSRGCSWSLKNQCTFCGISLTRYRQKTPEKLAKEIGHLAQRYDPELFIATDLSAPPVLEKLLDRLAKRQPPLKFAYCMRADLQKETLERLRKSGLHYVNIGIESLSTPILKLMHKGTTTLMNLQAMKWCRELGISLTWTLLYGIPGEDPAEYEKMSKLLPLLFHLTPPYTCSRINLLRESPYFANPVSHGLVNVRPAELYHYLLPDFSEQSLWNLAYFYDYDFADEHDPEAYFAPVRPLVESWSKAAPTSILAYVDDGGCLRIFDTRPVSRQESFTFTNLKRRLYLACDEMKSLRSLSQQFSSSTPDEIRSMLNEFVKDKLMVSEGQKYLSLAVDLGQFVPLDVHQAMPDSFWLALGKGLYCTGLKVHTANNIETT